MAVKHQKKFGYLTQVPPPPPPPQQANPSITVQQWIQYINSYLDVRARQIYDKLKNGTGSSSSSSTKDYVLLKDTVSGKVYKVTMNNGGLCSEPLDGSSDSQTTSEQRDYEVEHVELEQLDADQMFVGDQNLVTVLADLQNRLTNLEN